jgi:hypothetical protein
MDKTNNYTHIFVNICSIDRKSQRSGYLRAQILVLAIILSLWVNGVSCFSMSRLTVPCSSRNPICATNTLCGKASSVRLPTKKSNLQCSLRNSRRRDVLQIMNMARENEDQGSETEVQDPLLTVRELEFQMQASFWPCHFTFSSMKGLSCDLQNISK